MPTHDEDLQAQLRAVRFGWVASFGAVAVALATVLVLAPFWSPPLDSISTTVFYTSAFLNLAAMVWAFLAQYRIHEVMTDATVSLDTRLAAADHWIRRAILPLTAAGLFAVGGVATTGQWIHTAFLLPIFAFALLFYPTNRRVSRYVPPTRPNPGEDVQR
jgi:hypothetical protein